MGFNSGFKGLKGWPQPSTIQYSTIRESVNSLMVRPSYLTEYRRVIPTKLPGNVFLVDRAGKTSNSISFNAKPSRFNIKSKFPDDMRWKCSVRLLTANRAERACVAGVRQAVRTENKHVRVEMHYSSGAGKGATSALLEESAYVLTLCSPVVTICTASLTFNNSTFCPHRVFMCFVWIWEQTAIISLYSINWLVFTKEI